MIGDLQISDIVNAWALSTLVMEGCIRPSDNYEIKSTLRRREQVFIFKTSHFDGTNIQKIWQARSFPPPDGAEYIFTLDLIHIVQD